MSLFWVIFFFKCNTQGSSCLFSWFGFNDFPVWTKWVYDGMCLFGIWDRAWVQFPRYRAYTASHLTLSLQLFWEYMMKMGLHWGLACFLMFQNEFLPVLKNKESAQSVGISVRSLCLQRVGNFQRVWSVLEHTDTWEKLSQTKSASASAVALVKKRLKTQSVLSITNLKGNDPLQFS